MKSGLATAPPCEAKEDEEENQWELKNLTAEISALETGYLHRMKG